MRVLLCRAALLSSGVLVAVAHVRGGGLLGPAWHEGGRGPLKAKGLEDLLACAQLLVDQGYTGAGRMALVADSAGVSGWPLPGMVSHLKGMACEFLRIKMI